MENQCVEISYKLADGKRIRVEVSIEVIKQLSDSDRQIRSQRRQERRRHTGYIEGVTDTAIAIPQEDIADLVNRTDKYRQLYKAIDTLSEIQQRRVNLYYFRLMSCRKIAEGEGVNFKTVARSLVRARDKLRELLAS